jgi:hypothetical protein
MAVSRLSQLQGRVRRSDLWPHRLAIVLALLVVVLALSDAVSNWSSFWRAHQILSGLATELVMAALIILGVSEVLDRRARRRWRGVALAGLHALHMSWDMAELVAFQVDVYIRQEYGGDIPEDLTYYDVLIHVLGQPETWEGIPEEGVPPLIEQAEKVHHDLERLFPQWAPVLIHDPDLARLASQIPELLFASRRLIDPLRDAELTAKPGKKREDWVSPGGFDAAEGLVEAFREYDTEANAVFRSYFAYRDEEEPGEPAGLDELYPPGARVLREPERSPED